MTLLNATSGADDEKVEQEAIPAIESKLSNLLFPLLFQKCNDPEGNSTSSFSNIQGMSTQPDDIINGNECNSKVLSGGVCFPIDARFSLYFDSFQRRRLQQERQEVKEINEIIKNMLKDGQMLSAHPAIMRITYINTNAVPIAIANPDKSVVDIGEEYRGSWWWQIGLGIGAAAFLSIVVLSIRRKYKETEEQNDSESGSSIESDNEVAE